MSDKAFIDTNVFIYLYSEDETAKCGISQAAVDKYDCIVSTQVLNEFSNVCIRKLNKSPNEIEAAIDEIVGQCTMITIDEQTIKQTLRLHSKYGYNYFDCLMIASALGSNCRYLITEDLADGQVIDGRLTIVNIFQDKNAKEYLNPK